ncbi:MAG TPA: VOC family protein [Ramlibacter sp.]|uniref:VOC family protein n=1 Tax=Ramlibacter sp. TaxID=1917967 RepID=UPI002C6CFBC0|nr:VOC family protein [Ramlibacter sp.]HVZ44704.1 VOC family protein [Ramlibacter sp.]
MPVNALHHYTIRCAASELPALVDFYTRVMGLEAGARPEIPAPGAWLYAGGQPIVHLYAYLDAAEAAREPVTGPLDHIAFRARDVQATKAHLRAQGVDYTEAPIPGWPIHQVFVHDPKGLRIEMTFFLDEEGASDA